MTTLTTAPAPFALDDPERRDKTAGDGRHDFDVLHGRWRVAHRRLRRRLEGDTQWDESAGSSEMRPILGGLGTSDDNIIELPSGTYRGATVRVFNPETRLWTVLWFDSRNPRLDAPLYGRFENGVGTFLGAEVIGQRVVIVRFIWSEITATTARWEQAFSPDAGASWEVNWVMHFKRIA